MESLLCITRSVFLYNCRLKACNLKKKELFTSSFNTFFEDFQEFLLLFKLSETHFLLKKFLYSVLTEALKCFYQEVNPRYKVYANFENAPRQYTLKKDTLS